MTDKTSASSFLWMKLVALSLCTTLFTLGIGSASVALPTLTKTFDVSFLQVQWVVLAYLLATTSSMLSAGRLGDIFGRRKVL